MFIHTHLCHQLHKDAHSHTKPHSPTHPHIHACTPGHIGAGSCSNSPHIDQVTYTQPHVMTTDKLSQQRVWHTEGAQCYPLSARQEQPCHACQAGNPGDVPKVEPGLPSTEPLCPLGAGTGNRPELSPERKLGILRRVWHGEHLIPCPLLPTPAEDQDSVWGDR